MKKILVGLIILTIAFTSSGCKEPTNEEIYTEIQKQFNNMESYECTATILIKGEDASRKYKAKHIYKKPDKYLIEIIEPEESKGMMTIYNGSETWLKHPQINQTFHFDSQSGFMDMNTFIGYFFRVGITEKHRELKSDILSNQEQIVITVDIPEDNKYRKSEKIWINKKNFVPYKLYIFDKEGNSTIEVYYSDFKYNVDIKDELFDLQTN
ncbi:LolA family protein [Sporosalibacterium faouarense]|uniref:LolA family protein n=1 Tax=Sporosalibacterium faouarense TaxID=516123 RepID=UPI00141CE2C5|nr:outer membrane lipoprotein-sorting protein [Sporosalibacterium faouarense]MTI48658.1 outer membrane lipoprotein carrier protein LolA [Bacillota bacterium]